MKTKISDMMYYLEDGTIDIHEKNLASADRIKEVTMKKIQQKTASDKRVSKMPKAAAIVAALTLTMVFSGTALAYINWNGFAFTSEMSESEKASLAESNTTLMASRDPDGNVHYLDAEGNEILVLSAEEAEEYEQKKQDERNQTVQESTDLLDVQTLNLIPTGITEMTTNAEGQFEDFALGAGYMVILRPMETDKYSLKKGDTVTIALKDEEDCILEFGMIKDGIAIETSSNKSSNHRHSFNIAEPGEYNFYIMYYSANKGLFTDCALTIE